MCTLPVLGKKKKASSNSGAGVGRGQEGYSSMFQKGKGYLLGGKRPFSYLREREKNGVHFFP